MNKIELLRTMLKQQDVADKWFDRIPSEINMAFMDNPYVDNLLKTNSLLISALYGDMIKEEIDWWMEVRNHDLQYKIVKFIESDQTFELDTDEDFIQYLITACDLEDEN